MQDEINSMVSEKKHVFTIDIKDEEEKHKRTLSHYLEKIHKSNAWQNKDVAELLDMDPGTYSKIRQTQMAPITNSIVTLKKFAHLNDLSILDFIANIEEIYSEVKIKDWLNTLNYIMQDLGMIVRTELIHDRLSEIRKNDIEHQEKFRKYFVLLILLIDLSKHEKWFELCSELIINTHNNLGLKKSRNLDALISRIKIKAKK